MRWWPIAIACVSALACSNTKDKDEASAPPTEDTQPQPKHTRSNPRQGSPKLPAARRIAALGTTRPAPWLKDATLAVGLATPQGTRIVAAGTGWLQVFSAEGEPIAKTTGQGGAQLLELIDIDGDGVAEVIVGRGQARGAMRAPLSVSIHRLDAVANPQPLPVWRTARAQVVGVAPASAQTADLYLAAYESKYVARIVRLRKQGSTWTSEKVTTVRVPGGIASLASSGPTHSLAVARIYGDSQGEPGDVALFTDGRWQPLPSTRGARAIVSLQWPGQEPAFLYADGWHRSYKRHAQALLTRGNVGRARTLLHVFGQFGYDRLRVGDTDGDGQPELIAAGNGPAVVVPLGPNVAKPPFSIGEGEVQDAFPIDLDNDSADEIIVLGANPGIWSRMTKESSK